ncbi:NACHT and WD repeat domain-containing protein 2 isoform X1 [Dicentrarchus labrax]|uniref:NACHT and WD repeat domain-containing protein 2 isoform X1 n=1 Tax=Dicentrarchus labrax TaxID=13489 RepID=UPI0021F69959|nr:NACHT and WD repeat domain-containing protein 2 isoform X1 [Dicentrarchus labrax]
MDWSPSKSTHSSSCVKLYLCSNPEDSVVERRALRDTVFPKLRAHCRHTLGLDVRVIDPFESSDPSCWPDENTRQQLIKECRESSTGPFLLALVGHQYGTASLPAQVEVSEYQLLLQEGQQVGVSTRELERVYQRDENTIPPSYCLRPAHRHTCCPQQAEVKEEEMKAKEDELRKVFQTTVSLCVHGGLMTPERAQSYYRSALDADLRFALDNRPDNDIIRRCLVYVHKVINAKGEREKGEMDSQLQPQSEASTPDQRTPTDGQLFSELCDNFLPGLITSSQLLVYTTATECDRRHGYTTARRRGYAKSLCQQVYSDLVGLIDSLDILESSEASQLGDALSREQAEQEELCDIMSRFYDIVRPEEEKVRAYVEQSEQQHPLVVTGGPCTGKAVLVAHCAQQIESWLPDCDPVVITYFCNLSINPSPKHLLSSLCYQIASRYHNKLSSEQNPSDLDDPSCITNLRDHKSNCSLDPHPEPTTREPVSDRNQDDSTVPCPDPSGIIKPDICLSELKERLSSFLSLLPSTKQPLVLILDGLDHIENNFGSQIIESLPSPLPPNVKLILTASSNRTHVLQAITPQGSQPQCVSEGSEKEYVCVPLGLVNRKQCVKMLASLLDSSGRRVTSGQQALVNQALNSCCLTLYARLLHRHTSLWHSDSDVTESSIPDGVHSSVSALLDHLEEKHGSSMLARAVSYLTLSRTGLTEAELADLLCSDEGVLSEHLQQGESPSSNMRVPQVHVEILLLDLSRFLIRRTVAGSRVLFWVSRHFKLVVAKKYLGTREVRKEIHSAMADYFSGRWAYGSSQPLKSGPNMDIAQMELHTDRQSSSQPFAYSATEVARLNLRQVSELLHHLQGSNKWKELEHLLMYFGFHQAVVRAGLLGDLVAMLEGEEGSSHSRFSREKALLASILNSCACLLQSSPLQLPTVMEASLLPYLEVFPALKGYVRDIRNERSKRGGGLGVALSPAPSSVPFVQCLKFDAKTKGVSVAEAAGTERGIVAEVMDDGTVWFWKGSGCNVVKLLLSCEQKELKFAGVKSSGQFMLLSTQCNKLFLWDVTGPEMFLQLQDPLKTEFVPESSQQTQIEGFVACQKKLFMWWKDESFVSVFDVSSETLTHFQCQSCVTCLVCSSNGFYMYCGQEEGTVSIFDTITGSLLGTCSNSNHNAVTSVFLCEDKKEMACVHRTGNVTLWDVTAKTKPPRLVKESFTGDTSNNILNTDYSDEIDTLLVCHSHQVTLWDTCDWELWDQFLAPQGRAFTQAVLSQDGHLFLALLNACPFVLVWRVSTGHCVLSLKANKQPRTLLKMPSDIICVAHDGCLTAWDSETIEAAGTAPKMGCGVKEVAVERTGEWFYTTDGSETVWRWRLETGLPHANILHDGPVEKLRLSPNDIHLVTLSAGEIYVWQTETGENILRMSGSRATDILITHNGNFGVSISERWLSRVWKLVNGSIVCSIHSYLRDAQVSPENTFLIGLRRGDLLAASLWSGAISKRFSCVANSELVVAFHTISEHPDFVVVMAASGAVYTWKVAEETVCRHFQLPYMFHCQPQHFQMSSNGKYALLSTHNEVINLMDLSQVRLCSFKAEGPVIKACLDKNGCYIAYISYPTTLEKSCVCSLHARPVLTVVRLTDGERIGSVCLSKNPSTLVAYKRQCVFVGFEDGSVGVYSISDLAINGEEFRCRDNLNGQLKQCPFERTPSSWLLLATPNIAWP